MIADGLLMETPADSLANIWRDDPSLNQYQRSPTLNPPSLSLSTDGAFLSLSGSL